VATADDHARDKSRAMWGVAGTIAVLAVVGIGLTAGWIPVSAGQIADGVGYILLLVVVALFGWLLFGGTWTKEERGRLYVIFSFFLAYALFSSVFEQAGSTLNLFAERDSHNEIFGYAFPSSWYQSTNPILIFILAPMFAWLWVRLGPREPSSPMKLSWGLLGAGIGFLILVPAANIAAAGTPVSPAWLTATYFVHTVAELCLSPVGLSSMTKLAPARIASLVMGIWFLGVSVGNYAAGQLGGLYESLPLPALFGRVGMFAVVCGVIMLLLAPTLKRMMGGVK